jgi:hypothetical protein
MAGISEMDRLRTEYASKSDDELEMLAADMDSLTGEARIALAEAVMKRGLHPPEPQQAHKDDMTEASQSGSRDLVTVRWFGNIADAYPAKSRLDSARIDSFLLDQNMGRLFPVLVGGVKLQVRVEDADSATEVLDSEFPADASESEGGGFEKTD